MKIKLIFTLVYIMFSFAVQAETQQEKNEQIFNKLADFAETEFPELFPEHQQSQVFSNDNFTASTEIPNEWIFRSYSNNNALGVKLLNDFYIALPLNIPENIINIGSLLKVTTVYILEDDPQDFCLLTLP